MGDLQLLFDVVAAAAHFISKWVLLAKANFS